MSSITEENYFKALYLLPNGSGKDLSVNDLAAHLGIAAPTVTDMLKKLAGKKLIHYEKYKAFKLTAEGEKLAIQIIRKHRLWELFLVKQMGFRWDQVHEIAEQLEHIQSPELIERLDKLLGFPRFDPHGDPIPDADGKMPILKSISLSKGMVGHTYKITGVTDHSTSFLHYLESIELGLGKKIKLLNKVEYDGSVVVQQVKTTNKITMGHLAAMHLQVEKA